MDSEMLGKAAASTVIILMSAAVMYQACTRASTIYLFELDTTNIVFVERIHAVIFPLVLSVMLFLVYLGTKRETNRRIKLEKIMEEKRQMSRSGSFASRKISMTGYSTRKSSFSYQDENVAEAARRLTTLLSDIEEQDTIHAQEGHIPEVDDIVTQGSGDNTPLLNTPGGSPRFIVQPVEELKVITPAEDATPRSRIFAGRQRRTLEDSRKSSISDDVVVEEGNDIYKDLAEANIFTLLLSALNIHTDDQLGIDVQKSWMDFLADVFAIHIPVWASVGALYIVLIEIVRVNFAETYYYHNVAFFYGCVVGAILFGVLHEFKGNWITNNVLAFSSIYVVASRFQPVSYQTAVVLLIGMIIFDLFWLFVIDLLTTVTRESRATWMILLPRNMKGDKQSLATLDIMVPGVFLNVLLKYSSMYDSGLFDLTYYWIILSLLTTMAFGIYRHKITPAMVLPSIAAVGVSLYMATHRRDLWNFMIRH